MKEGRFFMSKFKEYLFHQIEKVNINDEDTIVVIGENRDGKLHVFKLEDVKFNDSYYSDKMDENVKKQFPDKN
jgi:hypothetical protein